MSEAVISNLNDQILEEARNLLLKARVFRFFALFFAVIGFGIFLIFYLQNIDGQIFTALTEPRTLWMILLPFLPAVILSYIAEKTSQEFFAILKGEKKNKKKAKKKGK